MPEVVASASLPLLAKRINREHEACERSYRGALEHAYEVGRLLLEAKAALVHGEWVPWLEDSTRISQPQAWRYMKLAQNWTQIEEANHSRVNDLSIRAALKLIPPRSQVVDGEREPQEPESLKPDLAEWGHDAKQKASRAYDLLYQAAMTLDQGSAGLREAAALARRAASVIDELAEAA